MLVRMFFNENSSRKGKTSITEQIANYLNPGCLCIRQAHNPLESSKHGIGHIVGNRPNKEQGSKQDKREHDSRRH
ncbi:hypothetical protein SDC9_83932 [bioreactor metagenome]|uniref:Uncharacterized protein n=1 Tax=bioreactor metagenome TaxID=1076179 RepID=A0A644Z928_9ZZZZ